MSLPFVVGGFSAAFFTAAGAVDWGLAWTAAAAAPATANTWPHFRHLIREPPGGVAWSRKAVLQCGQTIALSGIGMSL